MKIKLGSKEVFWIVCVMCIAFFAYFFGVVGLKILAAAVFVYFLPFYLILGRFDIEEGELMIFAFFIGLGAVSMLAFYLGSFFGLRMSYAVSVAIFYVAAIVLRYKDLGKLKTLFKSVSDSVSLED